MLQALILSQYKQMVAAKYKIPLDKPVILFKEKSIPRSKENRKNFRTLIDELTGNQIDSIQRSKVPAVQRAFRFFDENNTSAELLAQQLKSEFDEDYCLTVNSKEERKNYQILINTLEDQDNHIRAIFAVQQLNEG